ncbi:hypothetical protein N7509_007752 [Penicillium cosmopolitanum]|uniref:Uncharacterized protein n=1 Tax=Penicillium cosmopolitanum TaxID=1131564 RepID=A0A9W9VZE7_9EURO|nr:uncharacterized protein N7509_007752 [Penicillium cosmopolitanum]KAJ5392262.1 hypothetical protein N7509_007752 [Penicillium cosmopolitanum]
MSDVEDQTGPLWGRLGVEQYLITNWDHSSVETPDHQRKGLVSRFLNTPLEPKENCERKTTRTPLREPTAEEIDTILRPYRCENLRRHADNIYTDGVCPMLLRTHYAKNADEKNRHDKMMETWINVNQFEEEAWWAVLDDVNLFDFGSEWRRIYDVLPEIAYPVDFRMVKEGDQNILRDNYTEPQHHEGTRAFFKRDIANAKQYDPEAWHNDRESVIEAIDTLQKAAAYTYIVIADEKAFESGWLCVVYLDGLQRIIREGRIDPNNDDIGNVAGLWANCCELLGSEFTSVSEKYRINGEIGKVLYQLTEENLADP